MLKKFSVIILLIFIGLISANATGYYVSPAGHNSNPGTILLPFQTINYALSKAKNPGDTVYLRAGTYREMATFPYSGTAAAPIVLTAYNNEQAIISGTDVYNTLTWTPTVANASIYQASYSGSSFEQLFYEGKPMVQARWPNLKTDSLGNWNFWDSSRWADAGNGSAYGTIVDASPNSLASSGLNALGALAVLNVGSQFYCYSRTVLTYIPRTSTFTYPQDFGTASSLPYNDDRYYLVGKLEFLDAPGEWFNDTINHMLYFYPIDGKNPSISGGVEIKTRNFSLQATSKNYITIQNITFWGTAFQFNSLNKGCNNLVFKNNTVLNSSWTEYYKTAYGQAGYNAENNFPTINGNSCQVIGNTFAYGALSSLIISGLNNLVENNIFHDFDYNTSLATPLLQIAKTYNSYIGKAGKATIRYNDMYNSGGVLLQVGQDSNNVCYNHLYNAFLSCFGGNRDVSMVYTNCQTNTSSTVGTRIYNNWLHNGFAGTIPNYWSCGEGIRGDDTTAGLTVDHNVTWNLGSVGVEIKSPSFPTPSQANRALNNTSFNNSKLISPPLISSIILQSLVDSANHYSSIYNNAGKGTYGGWNGAGLKYLTQIGNNYDKTSALPLEDTISYDFRPSTGSALINKGIAIAGITDDVTDGKPDIGAYERGIATYWIPGFRSSKTSFPIVPNGSTNVAVIRDQLMWKPAYNAVSNRIYFGTSLVGLTLQANTLEEQNVFLLPMLSTGTTYYWRVDAVMADRSVVTGDAWSFTTAGNLPVQIISFSGVALDKTNELKWQTANEVNLKEYEVQRLTQANNWETIGNVAFKGTNGSYNFVDASPFIVSHYRLKMENIDGSESFSKVVTINNQSTPTVKIFSDATSGKLRICFCEIPQKAAIISIYDLQGRKLKNNLTMDVDAFLDVSHLAKGLYLISVQFENCNSICKVIR